VIEVPENFRGAFTLDLDRALRDIAGVAVSSKLNYFTDRAAISACFNRVPSVFSIPSTDFTTTSPEIGVFTSPSLIRSAHFDLSESRDPTGVVVAHMAGVKRVPGGIVPIIRVDGVLQVHPPRGGEIQQANLLGITRTILARRVALRFVSTDGFQSVYLRQQVAGLRDHTGWPVLAGERSTDIRPDLYVILKLLAYHEALEIPHHPALLRELLALEITHTANTTTTRRRYKIDHPPGGGGSKDCADALACAVANLVLRRETWVQHGITRPVLPIEFAALTDALARSGPPGEAPAHDDEDGGTPRALPPPPRETYFSRNPGAPLP